MNPLDLLTASLLRPFALAAAAWLLLRIFRVRHPASRHAAWTAVLIGTLILPPLTLLAPKMTLRVLPAKTLPAATIPAAAVAPVSEPVISIDAIPEPANLQTPSRHWPTTQTLIIWLYVAGFVAMLVWRLIAWNVLRGIMSRSNRIHRFVHQSDDVLTPVTCGVLQRSIVLPMDWRTWPRETRRAALAHEYAHIRRQDTLTLALTRFGTCVYWFHPLAWWLAREISDLAELSCDAAVLEKGGNAAAYSRILLAFAEKVTEAQHRIALPRMAFATASGMSRRIDRIFELSSGNLRELSRPRLLLAVSGLPLTCLIAAVGLGSPTTPPRLELPRPAEAKVLAQSTPAPASVARQSTAAAPSVQSSTPPQRLEVLTSFTPVESEDTHDALIVHGTLPRLFAQATAPPAPATRAQPATPRFEVASIKQCEPGGAVGGRGSRGGGGMGVTPGRLNVTCMPVMFLIEIAYVSRANAVFKPVDSVPISGGPAWLNSDRYTIEAKAEGNPDAQTMQGPMLRALLEDRFRLKIHHETKEIPVYELTVARSGLKLSPMKEGDCAPLDPLKPPDLNGPPVQICGIIRYGKPQGGKPAFVEYHGMSLDEISGNLIQVLDRPTINKTGIAGMFHLHVDFASDGTVPKFAPAVPDEPSGGSSIFTAFQEQLGLKLVPAKGPGDFLVIDSVDRPAEN